jgi:tetratricopeptide (TPR) repeat protein
MSRDFFRNSAMLGSALGLVSCLGVALSAAQFSADPSVAAALGGFLGNVSANLGTDFIKLLTGSRAARFAQSFSGLDENGHIAKGVRRAQLRSLRAFLDRWRKSLPKPGLFRRVSREEQAELDFARTLDEWLSSEETDAALDAWADAVRSDPATAAQGRDRREAFEKAFGAEVASGATIAQRADKARDLAAEQVFNELLAGIAQGHTEGLPTPLAFKTAFFGPDGWFGFYLRAIGEQFKDDGEFKRLWESVHQAGVKAMLEDAVAKSRAILAGDHKDAGLRPAVTPGEKDIENRPTNLLLARHRIVPFTDFGGRLADLVAWANAPDKPGERSVAGRLYTGGGGVGKTRLALALADALGDEPGWLRLEISRDADPAKVWRALSALDGPSPRGILAIVDYAEGRPEILTKLAEEASEARSCEGPNLRIVALARTAADWWQKARGGLGMGLFDPNPIALDDADAKLDQNEREALFDAAESVFRPWLERLKLVGGTAARPNLAAPLFDRPLAVLMAAYLRVRGVSLADGDKLFDEMLDEEEKHWTAALHAHEDGIVALRRGSAQITFVQGASLNEARALLMADGHFNRKAAADCDKALALLRRLYPGEGGRDGIGPIEPDILGEAAIGHLIADDEASGLALFSATLQAGLDWKEASRGVEAARAALELIVRRIQQHPEPKTRAAAAKLVGDIEVWCKALDKREATLLRDAMPWETIALRRVAAIVADRAAAGALERAGLVALTERIEALSVVAKRQMDLGNREAALKASEEASAHSRKLVAEKHDTVFLSILAMSLNNVGNHLTDLGRWDEALVASRESVAIRRELAVANRDTFLPELAMSLNNLGLRFYHLGRHDEALPVSEEATRFQRELVARSRDDFLPVLAKSLTNLGVLYSRLGRRDEALRATEEALELHQELANGNRDAFLPLLANSLSNLGNRLSDLGRPEDALLAAMDAAALYRELASRNRDAFLPDLGRSLNNLGNRLSGLDRHDEALQTSDEVLAIYRELASRNRDAFQSALAFALCARGFVLVRSDQFDAASDSYFEGLQLFLEIIHRAPNEIGLRVRQGRDGLIVAMRSAGKSDAEIAARLKPLGIEPPPANG